MSDIAILIPSAHVAWKSIPCCNLMLGRTWPFTTQCRDVSWAAAFKERRQLNSENDSFLKVPVHAIYCWRNQYVLFPLSSKSNNNFPKQFIGRGEYGSGSYGSVLYRVPAVPVPTVHQLLDVLRFGSTMFQASASVPEPSWLFAWFGSVNISYSPKVWGECKVVPQVVS